MVDNIKYSTTAVLKLSQLLECFDHSGYYPIEDKKDTDRILEMFYKANLVASAWHKNKLTGISRSLTDFCYCCYVSDLAVDGSYTGIGIGKRLVEITREKAEGFYQKIGISNEKNKYIHPVLYRNQ